jgi:hypothetical protein
MNDCNAEHQQLVDDCEAREQRLSDWERGFVDSMKARLASGRALTDTQASKLEEVWNRVTAKG